MHTASQILAMFLATVSAAGGVDSQRPAEGAKVAARPARAEDFAPPEEFLLVGPIKTHFVRKGEAGRAVVLVHGFGSSTFTWGQSLDSLARTHRVYALDLKGFGLTAKPKDGRYHMEAYTEHLLGFLDTMGLDRPVLVGHSLGGAVVARLALMHPERVSALVLEDPVPVSLPSKGSAEAIKRAGLDLPGLSPRPGTAAEQAALLNPAIARAVLPSLLRATITRQMVENGLKMGYHDPKFVTPELVEVVYRPLTFDGAAEALASMMEPPPPPKAPLPPLGGLRMPALVTWGAHDKVMPVALYEQYAGAIPGARKAVFAGSGHVPHEEEAEAFNARLLEFLPELP